MNILKYEIESIIEQYAPLKNQENQEIIIIYLDFHIRICIRTFTILNELDHNITSNVLKFADHTKKNG